MEWKWGKVKVIYNIYANICYAITGPFSAQASGSNLHRLIDEQKEYVLYYRFDGLHPLAYAVKIGDQPAVASLLRYSALDDYHKENQETIIHTYVRTLCETQPPNMQLLRLLFNHMPAEYYRGSLMSCTLDHVKQFEIIPWNVIQELLRRGIGTTTKPDTDLSPTNKIIYLCLQQKPPARAQVERVLSDQVNQLRTDCETWARTHTLTRSQTKTFSPLLNEQIKKTKAALLHTIPQRAVAVASLTKAYGSAIIQPEALAAIAELSEECKQLISSLASETSQGSSSSGNKSP